MISDVIIIDDLLPKGFADEIEYCLLRTDFPWYFIEDVTWSYGDKLADLPEEKKSPALTHTLYHENQISGYFNLIRVIPHTALKKLDIETEVNFTQARSFLQLPLLNQQKNNVHIDSTVPHTVCLYYVCDSDGDTILFDKYTKEVIQSVTPKKNRAVLFNGLIPHCSSVPSKSKRCVINFNFTYEHILS